MKNQLNSAIADDHNSELDHKHARYMQHVNCHVLSCCRLLISYGKDAMIDKGS
jgi:hypothetical protein